MLPLRLSSILDLDAMRDDAESLLAQKYPQQDVVSALVRRLDDYITWDWVVDLIDAPAGSPGAAASAFAATVLETFDGPLLELLVRRLVRRVKRTMDEGDNDSPKRLALGSLWERLRTGRMRMRPGLLVERLGTDSPAGAGSRSSLRLGRAGSGDAQLDARTRGAGAVSSSVPAAGAPGE